MKAVKDTVHNLATLLAKYPLTIISSIVVTRFLGPENKGIYVYLIMVSNVLLPISFIGIGNGIQYYISNKTYKVKDVFFTSGIVGIFTGLVVSLLVLMLWKYQYLGVSGNSASFYVLLPFILGLPLDGIIYISRFLLISDSRFQLNNNITIVVAIISAILLIILVSISRDKLMAAAIAINLVKIAYLIVIVYYILKLYDPLLRLNLGYIKKTYSYGAKSWLGHISARANDKLDQLIIGIFVSPAQLGIYSVSYAVVNLLLIPSNALSPVLFNKISEVKSPEKSIEMASQVHRSLFLIIFISCIGLASIGYWLIGIMYGAEFQEAYYPMLILMPGILFYSVSRRVLQKFLAANGYPLKTSMVQFVAALVGIISYLLLIPKYGIIGGAIGSTLAYLTSTVVAYAITKNILKKHFGFFSFSQKDIKWFTVRLLELAKIKKRA
ncbi:MAG: oligosaccharide flippase family protein [Bacteroidota bacterium]